MKAPWWCCNGWWSPWCVLDYLAHGRNLNLHYSRLTRFGRRLEWICRRHDAAIMRTVPKGEDWVERLDGPRLMHHFETLEPVQTVGRPQIVVNDQPQTWTNGTTTTWTWQ